ncbi:MAG: tetratricopeptide repeat protein [Nitrospinae bacterium]|nr:tetratricopeptide repeat protein [Nitrospinota bacterium]
MKRITLLLFLLLSFSSEVMGEVSNNFRELLQQGNHKYLEGDFQEALNFYLEGEKKISNGYLYYNIGNCYYRLEQKGEALAYYRKAEKLIPDFQDLQANIGYIVDEKTDPVEVNKVDKWLKTLLFFNDSVSLATLLTLSIVSLGLSLFFYVIRLFFTKKRFLWFSLSFTFLFIIFAASSSLKYYEDYILVSGVITVKEVDVKSERNEKAVTLFKLHQLTEFNLISESDGWFNILFSNGKKGWIKASEAILIK